MCRKDEKILAYQNGALSIIQYLATGRDLVWCWDCIHIAIIKQGEMNDYIKNTKPFKNLQLTMNLAQEETQTRAGLIVLLAQFREKLELEKECT